jgi:hypothetical protein
MAKSVQFKTNNGFFDYQCSHPILGFMLPLNFFVPAFSKEITSPYKNLIQQPFQENTKQIIAAPVKTTVPVRRMMPCNRVTQHSTPSF